MRLVPRQQRLQQQLLLLELVQRLHLWRGALPGLHRVRQPLGGHPLLGLVQQLDLLVAVLHGLHHVLHGPLSARLASMPARRAFAAPPPRLHRKLCGRPAGALLDRMRGYVGVWCVPR